MPRLDRRRRPGRMEGIELDRLDLPFRIFPTIDRALHHVPELSNVSGPVVGLELGHRAGRKARPVGPVQLDRHAAPEVVGEQGDVPAPRAEGAAGSPPRTTGGRGGRREIAPSRLGAEVFVRRGNDAHVDRDRLGRADAGDFAIFDRAQQPVLGGLDRVPSSSRKSVPPSASSKRPWRVLAAPVKLPASCPNSSASIRVSGSAAQFMTTSGPAQRGDKWCRRSAINSLPVPRSPITRTGRLSGAARLARSTASRKARL